MRKTCERCFREYDEEGSPATPIEELGRMFLDAVQDGDTMDVCPECRKELGIMNLLGVGE